MSSSPEDAERHQLLPGQPGRGGHEHGHIQLHSWLRLHVGQVDTSTESGADAQSLKLNVNGVFLYCSWSCMQVVIDLAPVNQN